MKNAILLLKVRPLPLYLYLPFRKLTFLFIFAFVFQVTYSKTYYAKATGYADNVSTWGTNTDGSGLNPANFLTNGDLFIIPSPVKLTVDKNVTWTIGSGVTLQIDGLLNINGNSSSVEIQGTIVLNNSSETSIVLAGSGRGNSFTLGEGAVLKTQNINGIQCGNCALPLSGFKESVVINSKATFELIGTSLQNVTGLPSTTDTSLKINNPSGIILPDVPITIANLTIGDSVPGSSFILKKGKSITVQNSINVAAGSNFTIESDANLIQVNDDAPANSGNIAVLRDLKIGASRTQYNYLGSPVAFATGNMKNIYSGITYALYYNEANNMFYTSSGANIPGRGLAVKEPVISTQVPVNSTVITAKYIGVPQNGIINFGIVNGNTSDSNRGYNLAGNPYPSDIDLQKLYNINGGKTASSPQVSSPNISPTFYFWDNEVNNNEALTQQGSSYNGQAYALYNVLAGNNGTGTKAASGGAKVPTNIVKVGQGFMVKSLKDNYSLLFNNSIRVSGGSVANFLGKSKTDIPDDRYWLKLTSPSGISSTMAVVYFAAGNNILGPEDSKTMGGSDAIYSLVDDEKLAINGKSSFAVTDQIALGIQLFVTDQYTIGLDSKEGIFANGQNIYLKDKQTGIITDLGAGDYHFAGTAGESTNRFEIVYEPQTVLATEQPVKEDLQIYRDSNDFVVKAPSKRITSIDVYDSSGRMVYQLRPNNTTGKIPSSELSNGLYILKINQGGIITVKKVLK